MEGKPKLSVFELSVAPSFVLFCSFIAVGIFKENQLSFALAMIAGLPGIVYVLWWNYKHRGTPPM